MRKGTLKVKKGKASGSETDNAINVEVEEHAEPRPTEANGGASSDVEETEPNTKKSKSGKSEKAKETVDEEKEDEAKEDGNSGDEFDKMAKKSAKGKRTVRNFGTEVSGGKHPKRSTATIDDNEDEEDNAKEKVDEENEDKAIEEEAKEDGKSGDESDKIAKKPAKGKRSIRSFGTEASGGKRAKRSTGTIDDNDKEDASDKEEDIAVESEEDWSMKNEKSKNKKTSPKKRKSVKAVAAKKGKISTKAKEAEASESEEEYEVDKVVDMKESRGKREFKIRWKGYTSSSDTWEAEEGLSCPAAIKAYFAANPAKEASKKEKRGRPKKAAKKEEENGDESDEDEQEYEVEKVLELHNKKNRKREFLIRWKGFSKKDDTWEPEEHLNCHDLIDSFMKRVDKAKDTTEKELRVAPAHTDRFTLSTQGRDRRLSKRRDGKQRVSYHNFE